jgi:hypothetical protein
MLTASASAQTVPAETSVEPIPLASSSLTKQGTGMWSADNGDVRLRLAQKLLLARESIKSLSTFLGFETTQFGILLKAVGA